MQFEVSSSFQRLILRQPNFEPVTPESGQLGRRPAATVISLKAAKHFSSILPYFEIRQRNAPLSSWWRPYRQDRTDCPGQYQASASDKTHSTNGRIWRRRHRWQCPDRCCSRTGSIDSPLHHRQQWRFSWSDDTIEQVTLGWTKVSRLVWRDSQSLSHRNRGIRVLARWEYALKTLLLLARTDGFRHFRRRIYNDLNFLQR